MTITATSLPVFPDCPSYGFSSQPEYLVKIVRREGGIERRDRKWQEPLHYYEGAPLGPRPQADIEAIAEFWHAMGGTHQRFLFKDYADYKSCYIDDSIAHTDQSLVSLGGNDYQMVKTYTSGSITTTRTIRHPIGTTVRIGNNSGTEQVSSKWTIDEDTGILTKGGTFSGTPTTWGAEFYVPVRFDGPLRVEIVENKIFSLVVTLREVRASE
jgi:uncharacterized protein (TIGR02217 family)